MRLSRDLELVYIGLLSSPLQPTPKFRGSAPQYWLTEPAVELTPVECCSDQSTTSGEKTPMQLWRFWDRGNAPQGSSQGCFFGSRFWLKKSSWWGRRITGKKSCINKRTIYEQKIFLKHNCNCFWFYSTIVICFFFIIILTLYIRSNIIYDSCIFNSWVYPIFWRLEATH